MPPFMSEEKWKESGWILFASLLMGFSASSDFKKWTEKEVLALKGMGPVTVKS